MFTVAHLSDALVLVPPSVAALRWAPSDLIPGWSVDGATVSFPLSSLPDLAASVADGLSGDARQVAASMLSAIFVWYNGLATKPGALSMRYIPGAVQSYGTLAGAVKAQFVANVFLTYPQNTVAAE